MNSSAFRKIQDVGSSATMIDTRSGQRQAGGTYMVPSKLLDRDSDDLLLDKKNS